MRRDPYAVPPEFAAKRFVDPVHDFVGECPVVEPDWEHLRWCMKQFNQYRPAPPPGRLPNAPVATRQNDWEYVLWCTDSHQLNGVVRWRMLDERLADLLPNEDYRGRLVQQRNVTLANEGAAYVAKARATVAPLDAAGIPWVSAGSPPLYALLGMMEWPRPWDDIDIYVLGTRWEEAKGALGAAGQSAHVPSLQKDRDNPAGFHLEVLTWHPSCALLEQGLMGWERFFEDVRQYELCGLVSPVPPPEMWLWMCADRTYGAVTWNGAPLPLWALARLRLVAGLPGFSWATLLARMREWEGTHTDLQRAALATFAQDELPPCKREPLFSAGTNTRVLLHVLRWCEEAYPGTVPASFFTEAEAAFGAGPACICTAEGDNFGDTPGRLTFCEWDSAPGIEELLFGPFYSARGVRARIEGKWWRFAQPEFWESMDGPDWSRRVLLPRMAALK